VNGTLVVDIGLDPPGVGNSDKFQGISGNYFRRELIENRVGGSRTLSNPVATHGIKVSWCIQHCLKCTHTRPRQLQD
jgi:hypothetical protein